MVGVVAAHGDEQAAFRGVVHCDGDLEVYGDGGFEAAPGAGSGETGGLARTLRGELVQLGRAALVGQGRAWLRRWLRQVVGDDGLAVAGQGVAPVFDDG